MVITKQEVMEQLEAFLQGYLDSIGRVYGRALPLPDTVQADQSPLWQTVSHMYDYGVLGQRGDLTHLGAGELLNADFSDAEMFLLGAAGDAMQLLLQEDSVPAPTLALRVARMAVARHVLEGGQRDTCFEGCPVEGYLTIAEVALLADMDERSVRNAASGQAPTLATENIEKRTFVPIAEARRWLAGRKGFVPAGGGAQSKERYPLLSRETVALLAQQAEAAGVPMDQYVRALARKAMPQALERLKTQEAQ